MTCGTCPADGRDALGGRAPRWWWPASDDVDLPAALAALAERGIGVVLCEGGPMLNGHLLADDLVDEWCLTIAPLLAAGDSDRAAKGAALPAGALDFGLDRLLEADGFLFARYLRTR